MKKDLGRCFHPDAAGIAYLDGNTASVQGLELTLISDSNPDAVPVMGVAWDQLPRDSRNTLEKYRHLFNIHTHPSPTEVAFVINLLIYFILFRTDYSEGKDTLFRKF